MFRRVKLTDMYLEKRQVPVGDIEVDHPNHVYLMNNALVHNCPSACSFCKESSLAREFCQMDLFEKTGIIKVKGPNGEDLELPSQAKVKFWDTENEIMILGPIQIAICKGFPIATDSLQKYIDGDLFRVLAE